MPEILVSLVYSDLTLYQVSVWQNCGKFHMNSCVLFAVSFSFKVWSIWKLECWHNCNLKQSFYLRKKFLIEEVCRNRARKVFQYYSDSSKDAFGWSTISTCRRAWWKLRLISCCGKVQIQKTTPCLQISVTIKFYEHGHEEADLKMSHGNLSSNHLLGQKRALNFSWKFSLVLVYSVGRDMG